MKTLACLSVMSFALSSAAGDEPTTTKAQELADFAVAGFKERCERLRSGVFRVTGHVDRSNKPVYPLKGEIEIFCAFDFEKKMLRFDRIEPIWVTPRASSNGGTGKTVGGKVLTRREGKYVRTPDRSVHFVDGRRRATVRAPDRKAAAATRPFDVRLVGCSNWGALDHDSTWEQVLEFLEYPVHRAVVEKGDLYHLTWVHAAQGYRYDLWLDGKQDFAPVRYEERDRPLENSGPDWPEPHSVGETTWIQKEDVWVPKSCSQKRHLLNPDVEQRQLNFKWEAVNGEVEEGLFTWKGMNVPKGTPVLDVRRGKGVLLGHSVGEEELAESKSNAFGSRFWWLLIVNGLLVAGGCLFYYFKYCRKKAPSVDSKP